MKNDSRMAGQGFVEEIKIGYLGPSAAGLKKVDNRLDHRPLASVGKLIRVIEFCDLSMP